MSFVVWSLISYLVGVVVGFWWGVRYERFRQDGVGDLDEYRAGGTD